MGSGLGYTASLGFIGKFPDEWLNGRSVYLKLLSSNPPLRIETQFRHLQQQQLLTGVRFIVQSYIEQCR